MADTKLSALTELSTLSATDHLYVSPLVTGTRRDRRMTGTNLASGVASLLGITVSSALPAANMSSEGLRLGAATAADNILSLTVTGTMETGTQSQGIIDINGTITSNPTDLAQYRTVEVQPLLAGTANIGTFAGVYSIPTNNSTAGSTGHFLAVVGRAFNTNAASIDLAAGIYGDFKSSGAGTITHAAGLYTETPVISAGTITNAYGAYIKTMAPSGSGTVVNAYGASVALPTGATGNNIGVLIGAAPSSTTASLYVASGLTHLAGDARFGGKIGIGAAADANHLVTIRLATGFYHAKIEYDASNWAGVVVNSAGKMQILSTSGSASSGAAAFLEAAGLGSTITGLRRHLSARDTTAYAAGVGGAISLTGNYNAGATEAAFAAIKGYKENATDGEYGGHLDLYTRANGASLALAARLTSAKALLVQGALGVGNSASATTLGTVTKKIEVFDAAGASLGFVPIYDAIT